MAEYDVRVNGFGDRFWYNRAGRLHREDGPACEYADGDKFWYLNGKELTEKEFNNRMNIKVKNAIDWDAVEKRMNIALNEFDYETAAKVYAALDWTWWWTFPQTPTVAQIKFSARELADRAIQGLKDAPEELMFYCATGGLKATVSNWSCSIEFIAVESDVDDYTSYYNEEE